MFSIENRDPNIKITISFFSLFPVQTSDSAWKRLIEKLVRMNFSLWRAVAIKSIQFLPKIDPKIFVQLCRNRQLTLPKEDFSSRKNFMFIRLDFFFSIPQSLVFFSFLNFSNEGKKISRRKFFNLPDISPDYTFINRNTFFFLSFPLIVFQHFFLFNSSSIERIEAI